MGSLKLALFQWVQKEKKMLGTTGLDCGTSQRCLDGKARAVKRVGAAGMVELLILCRGLDFLDVETGKTIGSIWINDDDKLYK